MSTAVLLPYLLWGSTGAERFLGAMQNLSGDRGTLLSIPYAIEIICETSKKGFLIGTWFWLKENALINKFWILPLLWVYHRWKEQIRSKDYELSLNDLLRPLISVLIVFFTFRFWVTEQMMMILFVLSTVLVYLDKGKNWNYTRFLWSTLILWTFINLRLGHHLLLPIWDHVSAWANFITYQGSRYTFWMRSVTGTILTLYLTFYNYRFFRALTEDWVGGTPAIGNES